MPQVPAGPLTSGEVAKLFKVHPMTVGRWADEGKIPFFLTPGGQRRFRVEDVKAFLDGEPTHDDEPKAAAG